MLGALVGLLGAGIWAWWAAARNQRAEGRGDPARILGAPLLGEVFALPASRASAGSAAAPLWPPESSVADAYHVVVASLDHELAGVGGSSVAVTSVGLGDSRTSTTLSIAAAASEEDRKVLLIDADERTQRLSELCNTHKAEGNGQALRSQPARLDADNYLRRLGTPAPWCCRSPTTDSIRALGPAPIAFPTWVRPFRRSGSCSISC